MRTRFIVALILGAAALIAGAFIAGRTTAPITITPSNTSAEAGFARDMQRHHLQAVDMSMTVRDLTDDESVRTLAYDIATTQQQQAGQMYAWLNMWGLSQAASEPSMTWMTRPTLDGEAHGHEGSASAHEPGQPMPGLATPEQLAELQTLSGVEAEKMYLELMIAHHKGGIEMAEAVLDRSENDIVTSLAAGMAAAQQSEIDLMEGMLAERQ